MLSVTSDDNERQRGMEKVETATTKGEKSWWLTTTKNTTVTRDNNVEHCEDNKEDRQQR
jgi:hypothetical protein